MYIDIDELSMYSDVDDESVFKIKKEYMGIMGIIDKIYDNMNNS